MPLTDRHIRELEVILSGNVAGAPPQTVDSLRERFGVSVATIYNDLDLLSRLRISRNRGMIEARVDDQARRFPERFSVRPSIKQAIAAAVVGNRIGPNAIVYIDTGSTCYYVAKELAEQQRSDVRVVTANPYAVQALADADFPGELLVLGGLLRRNAASLHGSLTIDALSSVRFDTAIISVDFIHDDSDATIATFSDAEVAQKQLAIAQASHSVAVVADETKLSRNLGHVVTSLRRILSAKPVSLSVGITQSDSRISSCRRSLEQLIGAGHVSFVMAS